MRSFLLYISHMTKKLPLTREEKERKVIELNARGMNIRDISRRVRMSFSDIGQITRRESGDEYHIERSKKYSKHSQALELFKGGASNLEVAIKVGLTDSETMEEQKQYRRLIGADKFSEFYDRTQGNIEYYLFLEQELKRANLSVQDAIDGVAYAKGLNQMKIEYARLRKDLQLKNQMIYYSLQEYNALKNQIYSAKSQVEILNQTKDRLSSQIDAKQPNPQWLTERRRRRRYMRVVRDDSVSRSDPIIDIDSKGSNEKLNDMTSLEN